MKFNVYTNSKLYSLFFCIIFNTYSIYAAAPLGMFVPYDINIKLKKPASKNLEFNILGEKSYKVQGYATDFTEDETFLVNVLQIYEPTQNVVSMYQGFDDTGALVQTLTTPFTQLLDSIAGGPGGGVSNATNGIFTPTGKLSCGQIAFDATYGIGHSCYINVCLPVYFARLCNVDWKYAGTNILFADEKIQTELINSFAQDSKKYFDLNIGNWCQRGIGDLTILAEWQRDFPQRRQTLKNVQANIRVGISLPTGLPLNPNIIMPIAFGGDGAIEVPFGGGLNLCLGNHVEFGFSGQFWYFLSNEKLRRIKTFPTQTSLLLPIVANTYKESAIIQNFNLHGLVSTASKRLSLKGLYQHWRKQADTIIPFDSKVNFDVANSNQSINEITYHQFAFIGAYTPLRGDFQRVVPQFELFWKGAFGGTRAAIASTFGAQFSLIF